MKFYMHAGSLNHGCEAIVRSTEKLAHDKIILYSEHPEEDLAVQINDVCEVRQQGGSRSKSNPAFIVCKAAEVLLRNPDIKHRYAYKNVISEAKPGELFVSIGGDNYCYGANPYLFYLNYALNKNGARTCLWGCSIEPETLRDTKMIEDMKRYSFISARETITYTALKEAGLTKIYLYPDPAFTLETVECPLPKQFNEGQVVGINLSPLVQKLDNTGNLVFENYKNLIKYILRQTDMSIALIPHVCKSNNDDRVAMKSLKECFDDEDRIFMVNDEGTLDCRKLKYIISKCRFMITARTHASIAAYSTMIPTLVVGYSVKARGIAKDIFGNYDDYVLDIHHVKSEDELTDKFKYLEEHEQEIRSYLDEFMPSYIAKAREASKLLK